MYREHLLHELVSGMETEEKIVSAVTYFLEHIGLSSLGLDPRQLQRVQELLYVLEIDSRRHKTIVEELISEIQKNRDKNEY